MGVILGSPKKTNALTWQRYPYDTNQRPDPSPSNHQKRYVGSFHPVQGLLF